MPTQATPALNHLLSDFFRAIHAASRHDARPWTGSEHRFDEIRPADRIAGEYFDDFAAQLLGVVYFGHRSTTGAVGDLAPVAHLGDVGIQQRTDDEFRAVGDVDAGGRRVDDRADAHDYARIRLGEVPRKVKEDMRTRNRRDW